MNEKGDQMNTTFTGKHAGDFEVTDSGIYKIIEVHEDGNYISKMLMSKDVFIEAYHKWILDSDKENTK